MEHTETTQEQLAAELALARQRLTELQALEAKHAQAIQSLQRSTTILQTLLESASDSIIIVKTSGLIAFVNDKALEMFGYPEDELLDRPIEILLPEQFRQVHVQHREDYLAHPRSRSMGQDLKLFGRRRDGSEFPVDVGLSFIEAEAEALVMCVVADITLRVREAQARQRMVETLQKRNRDLGLLTRVSQTLTATLNSQQVIDKLLQAVSETIGAASSSVWLWDPDQAGWLVCRAAFDSGQSSTPVDLRLPPGQGVAGWVAQHRQSAVVTQASDDPRFAAEIDQQIGFRTTSLLAVPLQVRDRVIGVLEVVNKREGVFDTDDQALVETLAASAAIAIDNAQLVEALRQQAQELQARNEELDAFADTVAHDLKGPLGIMIGFATVLEEGEELPPMDEVRRHLCTITRNGRRANNIINELLLLARLRKQEVELEPLDMGRIMAEAQERLAFMIQEHQAEIVVPETWPVALGQSAWIEEVWANYLSNAIKYGGQPPRIELGFEESTSQRDLGELGRAVSESAPTDERTDAQIRFWVRDNGPGLTPEEQSRLFTPFTQFHQTRAQGHGLGLSIVRRIVEKLNGQVGVESQPGQGSVFFFTLPAATE